MEEPIPAPWEARIGRESMRDHPDTPESKSPRGLPYGVVVMVSLLLWDIAWLARYAVRWSYPPIGVAWGLLHAVLIYPLVWALLMVPWLVLVYRLWQRKEWLRGRAMAALVPTLAFCVWQGISVANYVSDPAARFAGFSRTSLPLETRISTAWFAGGGLVNEKHAYILECSPEETEALIKSLGVKHAAGEDRLVQRAWKSRAKQFRVLKNEVWDRLEKYSAANPSPPKVCELWTDAKRQKVVVILASE